MSSQYLPGSTPDNAPSPKASSVTAPRREVANGDAASDRGTYYAVSATFSGKWHAT